ncbi:hypothetical protein [Rhodococcus sp. 1168]|nr:hypothetical protein [Rhodococcus sp. 1168]
MRVDQDETSKALAHAYVALDCDDRYLAELDLVAEQGYTEGRGQHEYS